jgi:hypothetical protein
MDGYLRNALAYSVLPIVITLAGALVVAFKPLPASVTNTVRRFASGAAFEMPKSPGPRPGPQRKRQQ